MQGSGILQNSAHHPRSLKVRAIKNILLPGSMMVHYAHILKGKFESRSFSIQGMEKEQFVVNLRQWIQHMVVYVASFFLHSFIQPDGHIHSTIINQPPNISLFKGNIKSKYENITNVIAVRLICAIYTQKSWFIDCPFGVLESVELVTCVCYCYCVLQLFL